MKALIAIGVLGSIAAWTSSLVTTNHGWLALALPAILLTIWLVFCYFGSVYSHLEDLASLAAKNVKITAAEDRLEAVKALAADKQHGLPDTLLALAQEDNPVTRYMGLVDNAIRNVEMEKGYKAVVEGRIASRAAGPFSLVVTTFGSSVSI